MEKINVDGDFEVQVKRFYLPIEVEITCPYCQEKQKKDFEDDYLSYPTANQKEKIYVCCDNCDEEFEFDVILRLALDVDTKTRKP